VRESLCAYKPVKGCCEVDNWRLCAVDVAAYRVRGHRGREVGENLVVAVALLLEEAAGMRWGGCENTGKDRVGVEWEHECVGVYEHLIDAVVLLLGEAAGV